MTSYNENYLFKGPFDSSPPITIILIPLLCARSNPHRFLVIEYPQISYQKGVFNAR